MRLRSVRVRSAFIGLAVAVLGTGLVLAGATGGYPSERPRLLSGSAWLASAAVGQLTLLDGSSAEVAAQVTVAPAGDRLDVVQQSSTAYAVDDTTGTIRRVDGATLQVGPPATPVPRAGTGLEAFAGPDSLYALDTQRGILASADPATLLIRGPTIPLAGQVSSTEAALDDAGRLWVLDAATGDLIWTDHGQRHSRRGVAHPGGHLVLVVAGGAPVVVDLAARTATVVDPATGSPRTTVGLNIRPGDGVAVSGSPLSSLLYLAASRGVLEICDLTSTGCATALPLGTATTDLGPPVEAGGRLFVPDYGTGQVWIVDLAHTHVLAQPRVLSPHTPFQLLTRDGVVFFNDPESEHAGVVTLDGGVRPVAKYDPKDPDKGLGDGPTASPTDHPTPKPGTTPPTSTSTPTPTGADGVRIVLSTATPLIGADVTMEVVGTGPTSPSAAQWSFGDGSTGTGLSQTHHWNAARTYQVSVKATFPGGRTATVSVTIQVASPRPRLSITVSGSGKVTGAGLNCPPTCDLTATFGQSVTLTAVPANGFALTAWGGACSGRAPTCMVPMNGDTAVSATFDVFNPVVLPAPILVSPPDGAVLFNLPRNATVSWQAVTGASQYRVEAQRASGVPVATTTVSGASTTFPFPADGAGRWRVTAIAPDGTLGTPSGWSTFSFDTRIQAFVGTWTNPNVNPALLDLRTMVIDPATSPTQTTIHPTDQQGNAIGHGTADLNGAELDNGPTVGVPASTYTYRMTIVNGQLVVHVHVSFLRTGGTRDFTDTLVKG